MTSRGEVARSTPFSFDQAHLHHLVCTMMRRIWTSALATTVRYSLAHLGVSRPLCCLSTLAVSNVKTVSVLGLPRGGSLDDSNFRSAQTMTTSASSTTEVPQYVTLADPAPGTPFHYAFPVHDLEAAKHFYGEGKCYFVCYR
jgi:hypothetical protein